MKLKAIAQTVSLSALGLALAIPAQAAFIEDSKASLELRNFYFNRDFRNDNGPAHKAGTQSKAEEWAQGFLLRYESGFTEGTVGVGIDAMGFAGIKLDSGRGTVGSGLLPKRKSNGKAENEYSELGATFKAKLSESVLKAGTLRPNLPTVSAADTRLLPQTFTGVHVNSQEISNLNVDLGRLGRVNHQASTDNEAIAASGATGTSSKFDFGNLSYNLTDFGLNAGYSYGKLHNIYKQHILNAGHTWNIVDGQSLRTELRYARTKDTGSYNGKLDNKAAGAMLTYSLGYNKFGLAYQKMSGDDGFIYLDGTNPYLFNYVQILNFGRKDEKSWQARYDYNFEGLGIPGLTLMARYLRGTNFDRGVGASKGKEWERDTDIVYSFQNDTLKGLRLHWRNATVRSNAATGKLDENRLIVSYTIPLM